jgi:hypothetical protein
MKATARLAMVMGTPIMEITLLPDNELDCKKVEALADLMPLRFRLPFENVGALGVDAAEINYQHIQKVWR